MYVWNKFVISILNFISYIIFLCNTFLIFKLTSIVLNLEKYVFFSWNSCIEWLINTTCPNQCVRRIISLGFWSYIYCGYATDTSESQSCYDWTIFVSSSNCRRAKCCMALCRVREESFIMLTRTAVTRKIYRPHAGR